MDGGRKREHRDQRRTDRDADFAPTQRRAHAQAAVIHVRYQGSAPCPAASPVLPAPPLKRGSGPIKLNLLQCGSCGIAISGANLVSIMLSEDGQCRKLLFAWRH